MCLLIGPAGVGKTLLLKRLHRLQYLLAPASIVSVKTINVDSEYTYKIRNMLKGCSNKNNYSHLDEAPATIPTVGTNLVNVLTSKRAEITVRELGGCMAPIWHKYYEDCPSIIFMVDMANRSQVAASCIQLLDVLSNPALADTHILILLNKVDLTGCMSRQEVNFVFRFEDILKHAKQDIEIIELSAREGQGLSEVARWLQNHCKPNS